MCAEGEGGPPIGDNGIQDGVDAATAGMSQVRERDNSRGE
jgi:hypothetical protein